MALSKDKKVEVVEQVGRLLDSSKLTVIAKYPGTSVKSMQELRRQAGQSGTEIHVVKNRLVKKALKDTERLKDVDTSVLSGQLMYAFNAEDEVAPAQSLANFAKTEPQIQFVGAISSDGKILSAEDVASLAALPSKLELRAMLAGAIAAPLSSLVSVMSGNIRGVMNVLNARAEKIS